jgi:hypothetical protein
MTSGTMKVVRSSALSTGRLYPQEFSWYSFLEAESTPGHMVQSVATEKFPATQLGIDPETLRLVAQCHNHYATPGPRQQNWRNFFKFLPHFHISVFNFVMTSHPYIFVGSDILHVYLFTSAQNLVFLERLSFHTRLKKIVETSKRKIIKHNTLTLLQIKTNEACTLRQGLKIVEV